MEVSRTVKTIRQKSLLSQEDFAKALGVAFTTVNRWESGKCKPSYRTIKLLDQFCREKEIPFNAEELLASIDE